jgi:hypothetical protein
MAGKLYVLLEQLWNNKDKGECASGETEAERRQFEQELAEAYREDFRLPPVETPKPESSPLTPYAALMAAAEAMRVAEKVLYNWAESGIGGDERYRDHRISESLRNERRVLLYRASYYAPQAEAEGEQSQAESQNDE